MNSKERVLTALNHEEPDRVPLYVEYTPEAQQRVFDHLKIPEERRDSPTLAKLMGHDLLTFQVGPVTSFHFKNDSEYEDEWGIRWKWITNPAGGRYTEIIKHPLANCTDPKDIVIPDFNRKELYTDCIDLVNTYGNDYCIIGSIVCTLFELSWFLRGLTQIMQDMYLNKDFLHALLDHLLTWALEAGVHLVDLGVDIIYTGDDFGAQTNLLISPAIFREFFKPRYEKLYSVLKSRNTDLKIAHHSCGYIYPIIQDFIEIGLDILNPVQPLSMDPLTIKREFGKHLTIWGTVDEQRVLPFGTVDDVAKEVELRLRTLAPGGGFILAPAHNVQVDTSIDNIIAFYRAAKMYGSYPIRI